MRYLTKRHQHAVFVHFFTFNIHQAARIEPPSGPVFAHVPYLLHPCLRSKFMLCIYITPHILYHYLVTLTTYLNSYKVKTFFLPDLVYRQAFHWSKETSISRGYLLFITCLHSVFFYFLLFGKHL